MNKKVIIIAVVAVAVLGAGGFFGLKMMQKPQIPAAVKPAVLTLDQKGKQTVDLGDIRVSLKGSGEYLVSNFKVVMKTPKAKTELDANLGYANDAVGAVARSYSAADLKTDSQMNKFKGAVSKKIDALFPDEKDAVVDVLTSNFTTQP